MERIGWAYVLLASRSHKLIYTNNTDITCSIQCDLFLGPTSA